jgi:hypothetical protein
VGGVVGCGVEQAPRQEGRHRLREVLRRLAGVYPLICYPLLLSTFEIKFLGPQL